MKDFVELYGKLDETASTNRKIGAMVDYFRRAPVIRWGAGGATGGNGKSIP